MDTQRDDVPQFLERIGPRVHRRATPRFGVTLAGAGGALVVLGMLVLSGAELGVDEGAGGGGERGPGIVLSLLVMAAGYILVGANRGPLGNAGVTLSALAAPALVFFLTYDETTRGSPVSVDTVLLLSTVIWAASYLIGPGKGRTFYLALALIGLWVFVLEQVDPFFSDASFFGLVFAVDGDDAFTTRGVVSLFFGVGYVAVAWVVEGRGLAGLATPLFAVGELALAASLFLLGPELEAAGTGVLALVLGAALAGIGAYTGRRLTTWLGGIGVFSGISGVIGDLIGDEPTPFGLCLMLLGALVIVAGHLVASATDEPDETEPGPSFVSGIRESGAEGGAA